MTQIANFILEGNILKAKKAIEEKLAELTLGIMEEYKEYLAKNIFLDEAFDAKFKGKTDTEEAGVEAGSDSENEEGDGEESEEGEAEEDEPKEDEGDDDKDKNITVNIKEENLEELSKATLGSYVKKASYDGTNAGMREMLASTSDKKTFPGERPEYQDHADRRMKRQSGIRKAVDKLVKEEADGPDYMATKRGYLKKKDDDDDDDGLSYMAMKRKKKDDDKPYIKNGKAYVSKKDYEEMREETEYMAALHPTAAELRKKYAGADPYAQAAARKAANKAKEEQDEKFYNERVVRGKKR